MRTKVQQSCMNNKKTNNVAQQYIMAVWQHAFYWPSYPEYSSRFFNYFPFWLTGPRDMPQNNRSSSHSISFVYQSMGSIPTIHHEPEPPLVVSYWRCNGDICIFRKRSSSGIFLRRPKHVTDHNRYNWTFSRGVKFHFISFGFSLDQVIKLISRVMCNL